MIVLAAFFVLGVLIGASMTNHHMRRRIHRLGRARREIAEAFERLDAAREMLADERHDLELRRRLLDG